MSQRGSNTIRQHEDDTAEILMGNEIGFSSL